MSKIIMTGGGEALDLDVITAAAADVKAGTVIVDKDGNPINGTMAAVAGKTVTPGKANQTVISAGQWASGNIVVAGDADLIAANIKKGVNLFGVTGTCNELKYWYGSVTSGSTRQKFYKGSSQTEYESYYPLEVTVPGFTVYAAIAMHNAQGPYYPCPAYSRYMQGICCFDGHGIRLDTNTTTKIILPATQRSASYAVTLIGY